MSDLYKKHFLKLLDSTLAQFISLLTLAAQLRTDKESGKEVQKLTGKNTVLISEEDSTRTRYSFEVAVLDRGACVTCLGPSGSQAGYKESIKDTARVPGQMHDGTQHRGHGRGVIETLVQHTGVPVRNGLTSKLHPTQLLADLMTMQEHLSGEASNGITLVHAGDTRSSMGSPILEAVALVGLDLRLLAPKTCWPEGSLVTECSVLAEKRGGKITLTEDVVAGVKSADFIYIDVRVSMGETKKKQVEWTVLLRGYQVNVQAMALVNNPNVKFLRCLPVFHDDQIIFGKQMTKEFDLHGGMEVTDGVLESAASIVFNQAENRIHTIKAAMTATLRK